MPDAGYSAHNVRGLRPAAAGAPDLAGATAPIAVIGMGCRFPDAEDPAALLDVVLTGRRAFRRLPPGRLDLADYYSADRATPDATYSTRAAVLEGWQFDLAAFSVPPAVYQAADPAQWLALETTARALAAAGFASGQGLLRGRTGVVIGNTLTGDASRAVALRLRWPYVQRVLAEALAAGDIPRERAMPVLRHAAQRFVAPFPAVTDDTLAGSTPAAIAARICSYFGFRGGGYAVDAAHASSLLAVASACTALATGEFDVALAGGVDLGLDPLELVGLAKTGALARGEMRIYDENPTGFLPGEGCGMVVLMRSEDARRAGLPVYAEIAGWGTSSTGQASLAVPDAHSQFLAMHRAYHRARIAPADVQLIEGHGAGTAAADTSELSALAELRVGASQAAALGSIKANIGNTKAAAGVAGLIKTVLAMSTGFVPPATGVRDPHRMLGSSDAVLRLPREPEPWPDGPRIAGVSAMGAGMDVHLVLRSEQSRGRHARKPRPAPRAQRGGTGPAADGIAAGLPGIVDPSRPTAYLLRAPDRNALGATLGRIAHVAPWLSDAELGDLACQLARGTDDQGQVRMAIVASGQDELARLASKGTALLSGLAGGQVAVRPGIYAADGAGGQVTVLCSDAGGGHAGAPQQSDALRPLSTLRWLDRLGVRPAVAVGYGLGELSALVWAGCLAEADATAFAARRTEILNGHAVPRPPLAAGPGSDRSEPGDRASRLREAAGGLSVGPPGTTRASRESGASGLRVMSAQIGRAVASAEDVAQILGAELDCAPGLDRALRAGAAGATLLLETGPGQTLCQAASVLCDAPAVSAGAGSGAEVAHVAAALFAAGALHHPAKLFSGRPSRPIDIWRERTFLTSPCQESRALPPGAGASAASPAARLAEAAAAARQAAAAERAAAAARSATPAITPSDSTASGQAVVPAQPGTPAGDAPASPDSTAEVKAVTGVGPWARCFIEELRSAPNPPSGDGPWHVRAATQATFAPVVRELFADDPGADCALAIVGDPASPDSCAVALAAARDAISRGRLVLITHTAGFTGFCATLHAEHPELGITLLRVPESVPGLRAARRFAAAEPGLFRALVIDTAGDPHDIVMTPAETPGSAEFPLGPTDVVLVSRGSGGAGVALAQVLACCGAPIAVIGQRGPGEASDIEASLESLRSAGVRMAVEDVDVGNAADLGRALQRIERRLGPVTAVAHAVSLGQPGPIADLTEEELRARVAAETASLGQIVSAITTTRLRLILTFGSIAGRYGLPGEGLLALASDALAEWAERLSEAIPFCRGLHIDWPAWSGTAAGHRDSLAEALSQSGIAAIPVRDGARLLLKVLATQDLPGRLAVHGRVGGPGQGIVPAVVAPSAANLRGRFLEDVRVYYPGVELVCDARLTLRSDPYLSDYRLDGIPVLPAAMALEAMAEAAAALAGRPLRRLTAVCMDAPVVIPGGPGDDAHATIRVCALRDGASVTAMLRCAESGFAAVHFRATFHDDDGVAEAEAVSLAAGLPELDEMPASHTGIVDGTELYGPICFQSGPFQRAALLPEVTSRSCRALVQGGDSQPWFGGLPAASLVLGSPGLADATWHVLQACVPHRRLLPRGCESVTFSGGIADGAVEIRAVELPRSRDQAAGGSAAKPAAAKQPPARGAAGRFRARTVPEQRSATAISPPAPAVPSQAAGPDPARLPSAGAEYTWDVEAVDAAGQPLVTWRGLRLDDAGPISRSGPWPPSLLSVYLERSAVALGLDPDLRIVVECAQPGDTGQQAVIAVPQPSPAPDRATDVAPAQPRPAHSAPGTGDLEGFVLGVEAPAAAACAWEAAVPGPSGVADAGRDLAEVEHQLRTGRGEPPAVAGARLRAVAACLTMAGVPDDCPVTPGPAGDDWLLLRAGGATLACVVVRISDVASPVAIAVMTGDPRRDSERGDMPGRRFRHGVTRPHGVTR